ncbi:MAG: hypothetical protein G01um101416_1206 [Microgenomates group bacterium Gr01-1014_16]|nr:MAG: hypothetical protein G01um101416_1206 [Microgenomates group bacterium Gr01-1014_16]
MKRNRNREVFAGGNLKPGEKLAVLAHEIKPWIPNLGNLGKIGVSLTALGLLVSCDSVPKNEVVVVRPDGYDIDFTLTTPEGNEWGDVDNNGPVVVRSSEPIGSNDVVNALATQFRVLDPAGCSAQIWGDPDNKIKRGGGNKFLENAAVGVKIEDACEFAGHKPTGRTANRDDHDVYEWNLGDEARRMVEEHGMKAVLGVLGALGLVGVAKLVYDKYQTYKGKIAFDNNLVAESNQRAKEAELGRIGVERRPELEARAERNRIAREEKKREEEAKAKAERERQRAKKWQE